MNKNIMDTGAKIKMLRALKNLTQEELAEKILKTRALVSNIEQTGKVSSYTLNSIIHVLGISMEEFENFNPHTALEASKNINFSKKNNYMQECLEHFESQKKILKELEASQKKILMLLTKIKQNRI